MRNLFDRLKAAARRDPCPSWLVRKRRLQALHSLLHDNGERFAESISADFGNRAVQETQLLEIFPGLEAVRHALRHGSGWMRDERRSTSLWFLPGSSRIVYQPLGVVGIIAPWNYPVYLAAGPLTAALAAGNLAMLKLSELTPRTAALMKELVRKYFAEDEVTVVNGDAAVAAEFSRLPFDHLLFTGSTSVGRQVMHAAAENLTPCTLELGGKSPAIVGPDADMPRAAERIVLGKAFNAGQTCIAPDYVLVPEARVDSFVAEARSAASRLYPESAGGRDYSSIVNSRHYSRLVSHLDDARSRGATVIALSDSAPDEASRTMPPALLLNCSDDMRVMQDEIFGPLLPVVPYRTLPDALQYVASRPRPLALYYFGRDSADIDRVLRETHSGGVGPSGMGHYHGRDGFLAFSKAKGVFRQARLNGMALFNPPFGARFARLIRVLLR